MYRSFLILVAAWWAATPGLAQDLMPADVARQLGLTEAWVRPINAPFGAQSIVDQQLYVHQTDPHEYVEIVQVTEPPAALSAGSNSGSDPAPRGDADGADADGADADGADADSADADGADVRRADGGGAGAADPVVYGRIDVTRVGKSEIEAGRVEAKRLAGIEIRRLKRRGINAKIETRMVPRVHIYSIASNGMLESRNAETGRLVWTVRVGDHRLPYRAIGVDDNYLSIINGGNLLQIDIHNGEEISRTKTQRTPLFGAINAGEFAMVPMIGGWIEGYPLYDASRDPFLRSTTGSALAMPAKSPDSSLIAWASDRGYVFVAESSGTPSILFRLATDGIVSGRIAAASGDRFFFGSDNGQVYGLRGTRTGEVLWNQPFGEPFYAEPAIVGEQVLIASTYGNLVSFEAQTGFPSWPQPVSNVAELMGSFGGRLYVLTLSGALGVINVSDGSLVGTYRQVRPHRMLVNRKTDRLYLVSERGEVQCLHPEGAELPTFVAQPDTPTEATSDGAPPTTSEPGSPPAAETPMEVEPADPFGGGDSDVDPFGDPGDAGNDPFGDAGDPFAP